MPLRQTPAKETWGQAIPAIGASFLWFGKLTAEPIVAVATPLLTAADDGLGFLIAGMTVYDTMESGKKCC